MVWNTILHFCRSSNPTIKRWLDDDAHQKFWGDHSAATTCRQCFSCLLVCLLVTACHILLPWLTIFQYPWRLTAVEPAVSYDFWALPYVWLCLCLMIWLELLFFRGEVSCLNPATDNLTLSIAMSQHWKGQQWKSWEDSWWQSQDRHGAQEFSLRPFSAGRFIGIVTTRTVAESAFCSQLLKCMRDSGIDVDAV